MNLESPLIDKYLNKVIAYSEKSGQRAEDIRDELKDHLLKKIESLTKKGSSHEDAIIQALAENGHPLIVGESYQTKFRWIDIRDRGTARGFIAMGPKAVGVIAFGGIATGVFSMGGISIGLFSSGGLCLGALAMGALSLGGICWGGIAMGIIASGGFSCGIVANGGTVYALWAPQTKYAVSYFTQGNVPEILRSMEKLLSIPSFLSFHAQFYGIMTAGVTSVFSILKRRFYQRSLNAQDWMIES